VADATSRSYAASSVVQRRAGRSWRCRGSRCCRWSSRSSSAARPRRCCRSSVRGRRGRPRARRARRGHVDDDLVVDRAAATVARGWAKTLTPPGAGDHAHGVQHVDLDLVDPVAAARADPLGREGLATVATCPARRAPARRAGGRRCRRRSADPLPGDPVPSSSSIGHPLGRGGARVAQLLRGRGEDRLGGVEQVRQQVQADRAGDAGDLGAPHERQPVRQRRLRLGPAAGRVVVGEATTSSPASRASRTRTSGGGRAVGRGRVGVQVDPAAGTAGSRRGRELPG
jgi:hypothetical protein